MKSIFAPRSLCKPLVAGIAALLTLIAQPAHAVVTYLGSAVVDGLGTDFSGLSGTLEDGTAKNTLNGLGSGLAYSGVSNIYYLLPDRGPNKVAYTGGAGLDNTTSWDTRLQAFRINLSGANTYATNSFSITATNIGTSLFKNEAGQNLVGISTAFTSGNAPGDNLRFDPESIRVAPDSTLYVSDEYGPDVYHFDKFGNRLGVLSVPAKFLINASTYSSLGANEISGNTVGRVTNKGLEGLAITPDGSHLLLTIQAPLIQDGGDGTRNARLLYFDLNNPGAAPKEFLYKLDQDTSKPGQNASKLGLSDIVAINDHQFLVDERDGGPNLSKFGKIIDITGATDISGIASLSALSSGDLAVITPVSKSSFLDIKALTGGNAASSFLNASGFTLGIPDKVEGFAFGPDLADGRHLLLVSNDNDFVTASTSGVHYPNYIMAFAIDSSDLPGFQAQSFNSDISAVPEPTSALTGALLAALGSGSFLRRRRQQPSV